MIRKRVLAAFFLTLTLWCSTSFAQSNASVTKKAAVTKKKRTVNLDTVQHGVASYYAAKFHGRRTASGQLYDSTKLTAAHNSLPFGTRVKVTNKRNGRTAVVRINDRLHYANTRVVDLSAAAAKKLGLYRRGLGKVKVEVLRKK